MADTPEGRIKRKIVAYFKSVPGLWYTPVPQNGYGKSGVPDYLVCYKGRFLGVEVKAPGKTATPWQKREIAAIVDAGGAAEVVWSVEDVAAMIETI